VDELELMHEAGLSTSEAVVAATSRAARALAIDKQTGAIGEGLDADIIAVAGDPLESLGALRQIRMVMKQGEIYVRAGQTTPQAVAAS
jgi:imidazolonepropionase-like amidohydrolase